MNAVEPPLAPLLSSWLRRNHAAMLDELATLVTLESPTCAPAACEPVFDHIRSALADLGYRSVRLPGTTTAGALLSVPPETSLSEPLQLVVGHVDTVWPLGTLARMPYRVVDGVATGPGVYDMKAGIVQLLWALRGIAELGLAPAVQPVVFLNADEEIASPDSGDWLDRLATLADRALVLEPSHGQHGALKTARKGVAHYTVRAHGRCAHAGLEPERGVHAILEMSHVVQALCGMADAEAGLTVNPGVIRGGTRRNVVPHGCEVDVDVRAPTSAGVADADRRIRALTPTVPGARLEITGRLTKAPMESTPASQRLWRRAAAHGHDLGLALEQRAVGGASDGNTTSQRCPTLDGLGAVGDGAHAPSEHVQVDTMPDRAALLALLLLDPPLAG
ncbi:MAG: glutamate carboxypeptidase [Myxococcota bacterium]|jgi:glutamate carboxypeptidase